MIYVVTTLALEPMGLPSSLPTPSTNSSATPNTSAGQHDNDNEMPGESLP